MRKPYKDNPNLGLSFLYNTYLGRIILKPLVKNNKISSIMGKFMDSRLSKILIKRFVLNNKIDLTDYEDKNYNSFNDFFIRKIKKDKRNKEIPIDELNEVLITNEEIEEKICRQEETMELFTKMQKLDEESRNVMYLRILGNFNYEEIAEITGKTANWARVTFFRGKQKLKEENNNEKGM